jgi:hypothetical protein
MSVDVLAGPLRGAVTARCYGVCSLAALTAQQDLAWSLGRPPVCAVSCCYVKNYPTLRSVPRPQLEAARELSGRIVDFLAAAGGRAPSGAVVQRFAPELRPALAPVFRQLLHQARPPPRWLCPLAQRARSIIRLCQPVRACARLPPAAALSAAPIRGVLRLQRVHMVESRAHVALQSRAAHRTSCRAFMARGRSTAPGVLCGLGRSVSCGGLVVRALACGASAACRGRNAGAQVAQLERADGGKAWVLRPDFAPRRPQ